MTTRIPPRPADTPAESRLRAFKATDAFVVEAFRLTAAFEGATGRDLGREIREAAGRCGGALVAASVASRTTSFCTAEATFLNAGTCR